jgi:hypothetical protein
MLMIERGVMKIFTYIEGGYEISSTLIDHIYTIASTQNIVSGIALVDISDHLPTFSLYTYNTSS